MVWRRSPKLVGGAPVKVTDRTAAEKLINTRLFVERAQLPEPEDDEFYLADLIGLAAFDGDGQKLGTVARCTTMAPARAWRSRVTTHRRCWCRSRVPACRRWMWQGAGDGPRCP